jgi:formylglycine-generating enzyme required for sulfatase activity
VLLAGCHSHAPPHREPHGPTTTTIDPEIAALNASLRQRTFEFDALRAENASKGAEIRTLEDRISALRASLLAAYMRIGTLENDLGVQKAVNTALVSILSARTVGSLVAMVSVPGGSFPMGSSAGTGEPDEWPVHTVTLPDFLMSTFEITQEQYATVMGSNPSHFSGTNLPVESVTWFDAVEFCNGLSRIEGLDAVYTITDRIPESGHPVLSARVVMDASKRGYRLPTEAEWEYAARGGSAGSGSFPYAGSSDIGVVAWYGSNAAFKTNPVGRKAANGLGLHDMSGNVWEWCWDWYAAYPWEAQRSPTGPSAGEYRTGRGGSWFNVPALCRTTGRNGCAPASQSSGMGFRIVRNP